MTSRAGGPGKSNGSGPNGDILLTVEGVTAGYGGGDILKGVSFTVARHEIMCIVGPNGSGKSTLLSTISGILRPRRGEIAFLGDSLVGLAPRQILGKGAVLVPQAHSLFPEMTVRENVEMGAYTVRDPGVVRRRPAPGAHRPRRSRPRASPPSARSARWSARTRCSRPPS